MEKRLRYAKLPKNWTPWATCLFRSDESKFPSRGLEPVLAVLAVLAVLTITDKSPISSNFNTEEV